MLINVNQSFPITSASFDKVILYCRALLIYECESVATIFA